MTKKLWIMSAQKWTIKISVLRTEKMNPFQGKRFSFKWNSRKIFIDWHSKFIVKLSLISWLLGRDFSASQPTQAVQQRLSENEKGQFMRTLLQCSNRDFQSSQSLSIMKQIYTIRIQLTPQTRSNWLQKFLRDCFHCLGYIWWRKYIFESCPSGCG